MDDGMIFDADGHIDEGAIHGWLDGQLDAGSASRAEAHVAECDSCSARVAEARGLIAGASRVMSALDVERVPGALAPGAASARGGSPAETGAGSGEEPVEQVEQVEAETPLIEFTRFPLRRRPAWMAAAAAVLLMAGTAYVWDRSGGTPGMEETIPLPRLTLESPSAPPPATVAPAQPSQAVQPQVPAHLGGRGGSAPTRTARGAEADRVGDGERALSATDPALAPKTANEVVSAQPLGVTGGIATQTAPMSAGGARAAPAAAPIPSTGEVAARAADGLREGQRQAGSEAFRVDRTAVAVDQPPQAPTVRAARGAEQEVREGVAGPTEVVDLARVVAGCYDLPGERGRMELTAEGRGTGVAGAWWAVAGDTIEVAWARGGSERFVIRAAGDTLASADGSASRVVCGR
jgi:hypothetical protein